MTPRVLFAATTILLAVGLSVGAEAATCSLSTTGMAFGNYSGSNPGSVSTLKVSCLSLTGETVRYSVSPDATAGTMVGLGTLSYGFYLDSNYTQAWTSTSTAVSGTLTIPATQTRSATFTVYGKIGAKQTPSPGAYLQTATIWLTIQ